MSVALIHARRYMVIVKVGKPTERSKPGNRGKRDSQILLLHYLNRVHFDLPMSPLELEIYHQMRNVIGIDPAFYEYIFTIDADTVSVKSCLTEVSFIMNAERCPRLTEPSGRVHIRRFEDHRHLWRNQGGQRRGLMVDNDSGRHDHHNRQCFRLIVNFRFTNITSLTI